MQISRYFHFRTKNLGAIVPAETHKRNKHLGFLHTQKQSQHKIFVAILGSKNADKKACVF